MKDFLPFLLIGVTTGSVYGLAGTGLVLTYKTSGIFNFAHGAIAALSAFAFYDLRERHGLPWPLAALICIFVLAPVVALLLERMARRIADAPVAMKVVATVGLVVATQQLIVIRYGPGTIRSKPFLPAGTHRLFGVNVGTDQLIVMAVGLSGMLALTVLFSRTRLGRSMRAVVDDADLLAMTGTSATRVRRWAWFIGTIFAGMSGVLLAPTVGLDVAVLTLLVVQAFGAAAVGMFTSIPLTYLGGILVGVLGALSTKYVATIPALNGVPSSIPFMVLVAVLVLAPARWLVDFTSERKPPLFAARRARRSTRIVAGALIVALVFQAPTLVGSRLPVYTEALAMVLVLLSLSVLMRMSGQVSLAQLAFAAVGGVASARLCSEVGVPWILAIFLGAAAAVPVGALLAIPAIRRSGLYLALATFGFALLLERLVFSTSLMFGASITSIPAPRPSFAATDRAYFYVAASLVAAALLLIVVVRRSRLGRLLRAMADSPLALDTYGMNVTVIRVAVFCLSAFIAGLGGALLGPITGSANPLSFGSFASLQLIVVLVLVPGGEVIGAIGAAVILTVLPSYITSVELNEYLPVLYGAAAVFVAMTHAGGRVPRWLVRSAGASRPRPHRSPIKARAARPGRPELEPA